MSLLKTNEESAEKASSPQAVFGWPQWLTGLEPLRALFDDLRIEQFVDGGELVVRAEMPGMDPEKDITVTMDRGRLTIAAERKQEREEESGGLFRSEFRYGAYHRTITLPHPCVEDDVKASYDNGILTIRLPLDETKAAHTIPVTKV